MESAPRWEDLRIFLGVARHGTLDAAAPALGVHASTLHRRVAALEEALGAPLFTKRPRGYALTAVGEELVAHVEAMEEAAQSGVRTVTGHDRTAAGPLRLALPLTMVPLVAAQLASLAQACPHLVPVLRAAARVVDLGREADVALRASSSPPEAAIGRRISGVAWCCYAGRAADGHAPWVVYEGMDGVAAVAWRRRVHPKARVLAQVSGVAAMVATLPSVDGVGLLPCYVGDTTPGLRRVGEPIAEARTALWLLLPAEMRRNARVRAFIDEVVPRLEALRPVFEGEGLR